MAANPELIEMENGKTAVKMLATVSNKYGRGEEVMNKVKEGDMTHVSIDWFSNDIDVMGDTYATNIRPTEVSFIDNEKMDPVCKECTIETKCDSHEPDDDHDCGCGGHEGACGCDNTEEQTMSEDKVETNVKSDAESIVEREFASLRTQLEEATASKKDIESQYEAAMKEIEAFKLAEEERAATEAEARKLEAVEAIISREILFGTVEQDKKDARVEELSAWDESRLTGFNDALAGMPEPNMDVERTFGKGKVASEDTEPVVEREFGMTKDNSGSIRLNADYYKKGD